MKFIIRALAHELFGALLVFAVLALLAGAIWALDHFAGDAALAVGLIIMFVIIQAKITFDRARQLKERELWEKNNGR